MRRFLLPLAMVAASLSPATTHAAPACALVVQVVDEAGRPAAGGTVRVRAGGETQEQPVGAGGAAEFTTLSCGEAAIEAGQAQGGWFESWAGTSRVLSPDLPATARLVVTARTQVTIRVIDSTGQPVLSGEVWGSSAGSFRDLGSPHPKGTVTGWLQPGAWNFSWKSAGENTVAPAHTLPGKWVGQYGGLVQAEVGREPVSLDLVVRNRQRLEGRIQDPDGRPIPGVQVLARDPGTGDFLAAAETLADGRFVLDVLALPAVLEPVAFYRVLGFDPPRLTVPETPQEPLVFVGRASTRPVLHGRVVRKDSGAPAPGMWVQIKPDCGGGVPDGLVYADVADVAVQTNATGDFEARCAPECPFRAWTTGASRDFPAGACEQEVLLEIEEKKGWVLEGTITDKKGAPLEGLPVQGFAYIPPRDNREGGWVRMGGMEGRTGEDGAFRIQGRTGGRHRLQVAREGAPKAQRDLVLVAKQAPGTRFEFTIEAGDTKSVQVRAIPGATLCAKAVDAKGAPMMNPGFSLYAEDDDARAEVSDLGNAIQEGRLCSDGIVPARYRVLLGDKGGTVPVWYPGTEERAEAVGVSLSSGMNELEPVVLRYAGKLAVTLPGWSNQESPRIEYREPPRQDAAPDAEPPPWAAVPAERVEVQEGAFFVREFPAGTWELRACTPPRCEERFWRTAKPLQLAGWRSAQVTLEPPPPPPEDPADPRGR